MFADVACMMLMIMVLMVMMADENHDDMFYSVPPNRTAHSSRPTSSAFSVRRILSKLRSVAFFACCFSGFLELCELRFFPVVEDHPHEASSASADVDETVVLPFQATMAGCHSEPVGLLSQLVVSVLSQDFLLLPIQFFVVLLQALQHCAPSQPSSSFLGFADFFLFFWSSLSWHFKWLFCTALFDGVFQVFGVKATREAEKRPHLWSAP